MSKTWQFRKTSLRVAAGASTPLEGLRKPPAMDQKSLIFGGKIAHLG
jgi:hypothetical protein